MEAHFGHPLPPAGNQGLRQQASLKRIRCGPVFTQAQTEALEIMVTDGADLRHVARVIQCPPAKPKKAPAEPVRSSIRWTHPGEWLCMGCHRG